MLGDLKPFENSTQCLTLEGLNIENGTEEIIIYGDLTITKDAEGLAKLDALLETLRQIHGAIHD